MRDLTSRGLIIAKGAMFGVLALSTAILLLLESPSLRTAVLVVALVWSSCRFYYFLFYVLQKYVDPSLRYAGLLSMLRVIRRRRRPPEDA